MRGFGALELWKQAPFPSDENFGKLPGPQRRPFRTGARFDFEPQRAAFLILRRSRAKAGLPQRFAASLARTAGPTIAFLGKALGLLSGLLSDRQGIESQMGFAPAVATVGPLSFGPADVEADIFELELRSEQTVFSPFTLFA